MGVSVSGIMHVVHDDGTEGDPGSGAVHIIEPGHDAWVVGDEPVVAFEFDNSTALSHAQSS